MKKLGEYELLREIGQGAMGTVWEARMPVIDKVVAIKALNLSDFREDEREELRKRFVREASLLWEINHPNVISIHHVGAANGVPYFVMEHLPATLRDKLGGSGDATRRVKKQMAESEVVRILKSLLAALKCLHDAGGVHRDVKPENILFSIQGELKLADFGIAKWSDRDLKTRTGFSMGTTDYMAPEQCDAGKADPRADLYAAGVVAYEMLVGMHPFRTRFQDPSLLRNDIEKGWDLFVRKATEPLPEDRFQSASEMAEALENLGGGKAIPAKLKIALGNTGVAMEFVYIPPGEFMMGSPKGEPGRFDNEEQHRVKISKGFYMQTTPVTQRQYEAVTGEKPSYFKNAGPDAPVEMVSWYDAIEFIEELNRQSGEIFRLPSEAEWEYACRAGTTTALYSGPIEILGDDNAPSLDPIAWYGGNSGVDYDGAWNSLEWPEKQFDHSKAGTHPVARKRPNPWGLYDMIGNVYEWTEDDWHDHFRNAPTDGSAWEDEPRSSERASRGGCWASVARFCRSASRDFQNPSVCCLSEQSHFGGFRLTKNAASI